MKKQRYTLEADHISAIESVIAKGDRVEVGPGPNGTIKILRIRREFVKTGQGKDCSKS